jgi:hypothetical protein
VSSRPHPESGRPLRGPLQSFDLGAEVARLREEEALRGGRRNSITLRKGEGMSVVLLVMGAGGLVYVPKGCLRATRSASGEFAYLSVHRRRGPVRLTPRGGTGDEIGGHRITGGRSSTA